MKSPKKNSTKKQGSTVRKREVTTNLYDDDGKERLSLETVQRVLQEKTCIIQYAYIIHDKDIQEEDTETYKAGDLKAPHIHLLMKFNAPQHVECIPRWFGLDEQFGQKVHSWEKALKYLIHKEDPDKYQYDPKEVTASFDYERFIEELSKEQDLKNAVDKILAGEIQEYNKTQEISNELLVKNSVTFERAFKVYQDHLEATAPDRDMECIFIAGPSQCGKTTLAKKIASRKGKAYFFSSASNDPLFGYKGQPVVILDELRPDCMGFSDLLKMLDNHTTSTAKARYKNAYLRCELIIITSIFDIDEFCRRAILDSEEPAVQLKRRCGTYIYMDSEQLWISQWDANEMCYTPPVVYQNDILHEYIPTKSLGKEDIERQVSKWMPFLQKAEAGSKDGFVKCEEKNTPFY